MPSLTPFAGTDSLCFACCCASVLVEKIVHRMPEILFATEVTFRGLDRCMTEQKLNLLKFTATVVAQLRAGSAEIMRCNVLQASFLAAGSNHVPDNVLRDPPRPTPFPVSRPLERFCLH
jgi:hypothetical protein